MHRLSRRLAVGAAAMAFGFAGIGAASAVPIGTAHVAVASAAHGTRVADSAEAWYSTPAGALCLPYVGCLPVPLPLPSAFPAGTLHVGATLGKESARTYIVPALPKSSRLVAFGGTLLLPVDSRPLAGTLDAGSARIKVCLTTGKLPAHTSTTAATAGAPPAIDCEVSAGASYLKSGNYFYVDLSRFLAKWRHGTPTRGVAIVPNLKGGSALANWHIAFAGKGESGSAVHSLISFTNCHGCAIPLPQPTPTPVASSEPPPVVTEPLPGSLGVPPIAPAPQIAPASTSAVYLIRAKGFRYPAIFIAPLAILAGLIFFSRLFTGSTSRPRPVPIGLGRRNVEPKSDVPPTNGS